jgi:threonine dehydratase
MIPSGKEVDHVHELLSRYFRPTRLVSAESLAQCSGAPVYLKIESDLPPDTLIVNAVPSLATRAG